MLEQYETLARKLERQDARSRPHSLRVNTSPPVWATLKPDGEIHLVFEPSGRDFRGRKVRIGEYLPGNRFTFRWHGYATPVTQKLAADVFRLSWSNVKGKGWIYQPIVVGQAVIGPINVPAAPVVRGTLYPHAVDPGSEHPLIETMAKRLLHFDLEQHLDDKHLVLWKMALWKDFAPAVTRGVLDYQEFGTVPTGLRDLRTLACGTKILSKCILRRFS